jgi:tRNA dimethylallyltransferase
VLTRDESQIAAQAARSAAGAWILAGATATGKSAVCQQIAEREGLEILSADSMLVYRGMDIGTAKPSPAERGDVPYHGIDLVTPDCPFSVGAWAVAARAAAAIPREKPLLVTGGTGLYIRALTGGLDSGASDPRRREHWRRIFQQEGAEALRRAIRARLDPAPAGLDGERNPRRLIRTLEHLDCAGRLPDNWKRQPQPPIVALTLPADALHARIRRRVEAMFARGLLEETEHLRQLYPLWSETAARAIGYAEALAVLEGGLSREAAVERICVRTRQLAKRQTTWFRHQHQTLWCEIQERDSVETTAEKVLQLWAKHGTAEIKI